MATTGKETNELALDHPRDATSSRLHWYQQPKLRQLYIKIVILFLASTSLGYDASLLNGLQTMRSWAASVLVSLVLCPASAPLQSSWWPRGWKFYFVYVAVLVIECLVIWLYFVETRGPTLEEIAVLFDGQDAAASMAAEKAKKTDEPVSYHEETIPDRR
ncbi:hypothetical protein BDV11DRAFT_172270 [Aspergillus similis]